MARPAAGQGEVVQAAGDDGDVQHRLLAAAAAGDVGAFEVLVRAHTPALFSVAVRVTGSPQLAEEVVQDAWLSAWTHLAGFRGQSAVRTWLARIVTTKALNAVRRPRPTVPLEHAVTLTSPSTEQTAERRARADAVRRAVARLPGRQRAAVVLRDLEGLSYTEIAGALDCTVPAVKSALHRGRATLADELADQRTQEAE